MPVVHLKGLTRTFGDFNAVDNVDLEIRDGEFLSLLGPSGCGKTTTLRMIAGFIDPSGGTIDVDGEVLSSESGSLPPEKRGMSMIFQSYAIWPNMTVAQNVGFGLDVRRVPRDEARRRVGEVLEVVRMGHLAGRYPAELSGGQQQRVALARAIVVNPSVLLLDEPLSNLDANLREEMRFEIRRLHEQIKITTVYVTHDQSEAMATSDRIAVMNKGRIEQVDAPYTVYTRPRTRFVAGFIGRTNFMTAERRGDAFAFDGFAVPTARFSADDLARVSGRSVTFSVRPQSVYLVRTPLAPGSGFVEVEGEIAHRTFLGEHWDYQFKPQGSEQRIKVAAAPADVFEVGTSARLALDPALMIPIVD
ncbi:MAG TPA: ABC transporter ATP-binding protein [Hyphomicrobiaceae bacterium]|nr:ABC transporter ATP-binding protein [Hyphomicrobiaceae bacterium]